MAFGEFTTEALARIVSSSISFADVFRKMSMAKTGPSYKALRKRLDEDEISYSHFPRGLDANRGRSIFNRISSILVLVQDSKYSGITARKRVIEEKLIQYKCECCGIGPEWNGKILTLRLDHKNGKRNDHRLENLRFLCPNCDSQSETYGGRNVKWSKKVYCCKECGINILKGSKRCPECEQIRRMKCKRPPKEELERIVWKKPLRVIAKQFGVSDKAVAKWCKKSGIKTPGVGYWRIRECSNLCPSSSG
jgi:Zn finger protein HypA/HybF involved in hydrogenase expression